MITHVIKQFKQDEFTVEVIQALQLAGSRTETFGVHLQVAFNGFNMATATLPYTEDDDGQVTVPDSVVDAILPSTMQAAKAQLAKLQAQLMIQPAR